MIFKRVYYFFVGPFIGKFNWSWKSKEEIDRLKEAGLPRAMFVLRSIDGAKPRHIRSSLKKVLGKDCKYVTDYYMGVKISDFFEGLPPDIAFIEQQLQMNSFIVMIEGGPAARINNLLSTGNLVHQYRGLLLKNKARWGDVLSPEKRYLEIVQKSYVNFLRKVYCSDVPNECPNCHSDGWIHLIPSGTCDECGEHAGILLPDIEKKLEDPEKMIQEMEKHRIETDEVFLKIER